LNGVGVVSSDITSLPGDLLIHSAFASILDSPLATAAPIEIGTSAILLFTSLVWLCSYQLGLFLNLSYSKIKWTKKLLLHLQTLFLCPVVGLVETFPAVWAIIEYRSTKKQKAEKISVYDFYVINK
jgi:egghead protein (zeste-white 4 protein)